MPLLAVHVPEQVGSARLICRHAILMRAPRCRTTAILGDHRHPASAASLLAHVARGWEGGRDSAWPSLAWQPGSSPRRLSIHPPLGPCQDAINATKSAPPGLGHSPGLSHAFIGGMFGQNSTGGAALSGTEAVCMVAGALSPELSKV